MIMRTKPVKKTVLLRSASEWIDLAKKKTGKGKETEIAAMLGTTKQAINNYTSGRNGIGAREAIRLGWLINEDPIEIMITSAIHASTTRGKESWISILEDYQTRITDPKQEQEQGGENQRAEPATAQEPNE